MSTFSIGQMNQLGDALEASGWSANLVTKLGQCGRLADIRVFLEGNAELVMKKAEETVASIITLVKTITIPAVAGKKTSDCFMDKSRYYYRDTVLNNWLPNNQSEQIEVKFSVIRLTKYGTFKQVVESFLGQTGDIQTLSRLLKERGHITTLPAIELLIERQEAGEDIGLRNDGWWNFFFVEDSDGGVSVFRANRTGRHWHVAIHRLWSGGVWLADHRFFFRNSDTVSL